MTVLKVFESEALTQCCPLLTSLDASFCPALTDAACVSLALPGGGGGSLMTSLDMHGCVLLTEASVVAVAGGCARLTALSLSLCGHNTSMDSVVITDTTVGASQGGSPGLSDVAALRPTDASSILQLSHRHRLINSIIALDTVHRLLSLTYMYIHVCCSPG